MKVKLFIQGGAHDNENLCRGVVCACEGCDA